MEERRTKFYSSCRDGHIEIVSLYYQFYDMMFDLRVSRSNNPQYINTNIECRKILKKNVFP